MTFQLSEQQQAVVDWTRNGSGSAIVLARAGCGKTFTLIQGVVRTIVENGLGQVALMAYNKSAGDEFGGKLKRLAQETGDARLADWRHVQAGTVHSFGFSAVRKWAPNVRVDGSKVANLIDQCAEGEFAAEAGRTLDPNTATKRDTSWGKNAGAIRKLVSLAKQTGAGALWSIEDAHRWFDLVDHHSIDEDLADMSAVELIEHARTILQESLALDSELIDFDDMILAPLVHNLRVWQFHWVLIDEAQDTNPARRALALRMLRRDGRLVAVGDDRQAIYGFTGADHDALELIRKATNAQVLPLTTTYRCPGAVVRDANRYVPDLEVLRAKRDQGEVRTILERDPKDGTPWHIDECLEGHHDAVLCRNVKPLVGLAYQLIEAGVPCYIEGREVGEGLIKLAEKWKRIHRLDEFVDRLEDWSEKQIQRLAAKDRGDRAQAIEDQAEALLLVARNLIAEGKDSVADLTSRLRRLFENDQGVALTTIHKSKGREWDRVFLLHPAATLPSPWARQDWQRLQEDNLAYVAITRALETLVYVEEVRE